MIGVGKRRWPVVQVRGLYHATLPVEDLERAERFYRDVLGIPRHATPSFFPETVVFLDLGNTMVHLVKRRDDVPPLDPRSTHLAIEVDDLEAAYERVRAAGVGGLTDIHPRPGGLRCFFFLDTENNRVELVQP
jgi:glyoxylase I family protein